MKKGILLIVLALSFLLVTNTSKVNAANTKNTVENHLIYEEEVIYDVDGKTVKEIITNNYDLTPNATSLIQPMVIPVEGGISYKLQGIVNRTNKMDTTAIRLCGFLASCINTLVPATKFTNLITVMGGGVTTFYDPATRYYTMYNYTDYDGVNNYYKDVNYTYSDSGRTILMSTKTEFINI